MPRRGARTAIAAVVVLGLAAGAGAARWGLPGGSGGAAPAVLPERVALMSPVAAVAPALPSLPPPVAPSFDIVRVGPSGGAVLAGQAAPGAEVVAHGATGEIGRTHADASGAFVLVPVDPLAPGVQSLTLASRSPVGEEASSRDPVVIVVPDRPGLDRSRPGRPEPAQAVAVIAPQAGPARVLQPSHPGQLGLDIVDYDAHGTIRFAGSAAANTQLRLSIDGQQAGTATASGDGGWTLDPVAPVPAGTHVVRVEQLAGDHRVTAHIELPFERAEVTQAEAAAAGGAGHMVVQPGATLWRIARGVYGQGVRYTLIVAANATQIRNPDRIYPGQVFALPAGPAPVTR